MENKNNDIDDRLIIANNIDELQNAFGLFMMSKDPADLWQAIAAAERLLTGLKFLQASSK